MKHAMSAGPGARSLAMAVLMMAWTGASSAAEQVVEIRDYKFQPRIVQIKVGDTVRWINREKRTSHSVLFSGGIAPESERLFPDESWSRRFDEAGEYDYRCGPHPEMTGRVEVAQ